MISSQDPWMPCEVFVEIVTDYLEGALTADEVAHIEDHLEICRGCVSVVAQFRETVRLAGRIREEDVAKLEPAVRDELMAVFRDAAQRRGAS